LVFFVLFKPIHFFFVVDCGFKVSKSF